MRILAIEQSLPAVPVVASESILREEAARVWTLHMEGVIREIYFRADRREAVLMLEVSGVEEARSVLATLPLVRERRIDFDIIPLVPYSGFERLFAPPSA